jgi:hypothetical protein
MVTQLSPLLSVIILTNLNMHKRQKLKSTQLANITPLVIKVQT